MGTQSPPRQIAEFLWELSLGLRPRGRHCCHVGQGDWRGGGIRLTQQNPTGSSFTAFSPLFHSLHTCSFQNSAVKNYPCGSLPLIRALSCVLLHPSLLGSMILLSRIFFFNDCYSIISAFNDFFPFVIYCSGTLKMGQLESSIQGVGSSGYIAVENL